MASLASCCFSADQFVLAADLPEMDGMFFVRLASRFLHILAAIILGGGLFYMRTVLSPGGAEACFAGRRAEWAKWAGIVSFLLLASGLFNFWTIHMDAKEAGGKLPSLYHGLFGVKVLLALAVMFIAAILAGKTDAAERARGNMRRWLSVGWWSVVVIVLIGGTLRLLHGTAPADDAPPAPSSNEVDRGQEG